MKESAVLRINTHLNLIVLTRLMRPIISFNPSPLETLDQKLNRAGFKPFLVGVFNSQNKRSAVFLGKQAVIKRGAQAPDMQITSRTGRESNANRL